VSLVAAIEPYRGSLDLVVVLDRELRVVAQNRGADLPEAARTAAQAVLRTGEPRTFEWGEVGTAGVRVWYSAHATPLQEGGQIAGVLVSSRDVTELKRSEQRMRRSEQMLVDTQGVAHLGTWDWDVTQPHATWSDELYRIYGLTPETYTPSYEAYLTMVHPDDRQRVIDATNRVFHEHVPYSHDERIFRPDGSIRYLHTWAFPVLDEAGKLVRLVGVCQDITDRAEAELALQRLNAELEQRVAERTHQVEAALRDLESFNAMVSHDVRAPLAVIQMTIDTLRREALPPRAPELLDRVQRSIDNMSALVSDLLAFAQVGEAAMKPVQIDVTAMCNDVLGELRLASPERSVDIVIAPGMQLRADPALLRVVIANLLGNAWKYTSTSPAACIEVGIVERADGPTLFVRDNGIGFDMSEQARLFRPFSRLANAKDLKGSGIGLATVQRIVSRHGGSIRAEAAVGQGATFFVVLPA
jgi:PAS domain S-box-containing protein